ncbi:cryptochrome/photolyase family protein [Nocardioides campestrisoli]|uniref:cryptochrome/photolyase family protein n=1 Tax=Nocardioides campestrisoli TaxID=2736757 RepID=UPI00163DC518|nr:deoxyribodipyrimidine photo-lyase [Nocardioides campestrisoli]
MTSVVWFRRDLRTRDHPALLASLAEAATVPVFVVDPRLWHRASPVRRSWLALTLRALDERLEGRLTVRTGDPVEVLPRLAREVEARTVHVSAETTPYGAARDVAVAAALAEQGTRWRDTGSPYAVGPGRVRNKAGDPYRVFTPWARAWRETGWAAPAATPRSPDLVRADSDAEAVGVLSAAVEEAPEGLPSPGEEGAWRRWRHFRDQLLARYDDDRDRPDRDGTSRLSPWLSLGVLHPRSLLADLPADASPSVERFVTELGWREFYADVLHHAPGSAWSDLRPTLAGMAYSTEEDAVEAWRTGTTGYPFVDAGMRQMLAQGWMHNRLRMVTASFLCKDLHVWWPLGARHFLQHLVDADLASNNHGWQWVAGSGTDASPYFRVFNPVQQGLRFDPQGDYVRRWVPELAHLAGAAAHEPWRHPQGYERDYPARIVDHTEERREALRRYEQTTRER